MKQVRLVQTIVQFVTRLAARDWANSRALFSSDPAVLMGLMYKLSAAQRFLPTAVFCSLYPIECCRPTRITPRPITRLEYTNEQKIYQGSDARTRQQLAHLARLDRAGGDAEEVEGVRVGCRLSAVGCLAVLAARKQIRVLVG